MYHISPEYFHKYHSALLLSVITCIGLIFGGCGGSSSDGDRESSSHHSNDHTTPNHDGSTSVALGNTHFSTSQFRYTDDGNAAATGLSVSNIQSYSIGKNIKRFGVSGNTIYAYVEASALDNEIISYNLTSQQESSSAQPDAYITGFSFNGVILISDGSEDLNFYNTNNGTIDDNFFHISSIKGSKFISGVFLDHDIAYVQDSNAIYSFSLSKTSTINTVSSIPDFSKVSFSADGDYVYMSVSSSAADTDIYRIDKSNQTAALWFNLSNITAAAIAVDSNHFYVADKTSGKVHAYKKSDQSLLSDIDAAFVEDIQVVNGKIYTFNSSTQILNVGDLDFTP